MLNKHLMISSMMKNWRIINMCTTVKPFSFVNYPHYIICYMYFRTTEIHLFYDWNYYKYAKPASSYQVCVQSMDLIYRHVLLNPRFTITINSYYYNSLRICRSWRHVLNFTLSLHIIYFYRHDISFSPPYCPSTSSLYARCYLETMPVYILAVVRTIHYTVYNIRKYQICW